VKPDHNPLLLRNGQFIVISASKVALSEVLVRVIREVSEFSFNSDLFPIINFADVKSLEIRDKVFEAHPEGTIVTENRLKLFDNILSPTLGVFVAPGAIPFKGAPRIPNINEPVALALFDLNDRISMARDKPALLRLVFIVVFGPFVFSWSRSREKEAYFVKGLHFLE
jgi:hypothetical protein